jgi:hypothetical protein
VLSAALGHALAMPMPDAVSAFKRTEGTRTRSVVLASSDSAVEEALKRSGLAVHRVNFTPFDEKAAAEVEHFETYNRTPASQRVADLLAALERTPGATLVADGDAGLPALLAAAVVPGTRAVVDVDHFDASSDAAFLERLYIPGLRRAGDFATAATMISGDVFVHNAGDRFSVRGLHVETRRLTPAEIVAIVRRGSREEIKP